MQIHADHWYLWAVSMQGAPVGWYQKQPFYQPPRRGDTDVDDPFRPFVEDDHILADRIARAVNALMRADNEGRQILVRYYGAYPNAPKDRTERMRCYNGQSKQDISRKRKRAEDWVAGYVEALASPDQMVYS